MLTSRRNFFAGLSTLLAPATAAEPQADQGRSYWVNTLQRITGPVLTALAQHQLRQRMPVEVGGGKTNSNRKSTTHLEAFGRTLAGIAPWLACLATGPEETARRRYTSLCQAGLAAAVDPASPDYMNFNQGRQPLVDAAFLAQGILRAPKVLWDGIEKTVQKQIISALEATRIIPPGANNWLLFSATIEAALYRMGATFQPGPIERALNEHQQWYKGDGAYGDGKFFHWDYYNSFVIHPMMIDVLETVGEQTPAWAAFRPIEQARALRYAAIQERLISPNGTYPVMGRSLAYRCGAFHLLAQCALKDHLPEGVVPSQVREALTAVIKRTMDAPDTYDSQGWLQIGLAGHQPGLGENYISTGSLYLCTTAFLPLGLPATHAFWRDPARDWTSKRVWSGGQSNADHALRDEGK